MGSDDDGKEGRKERKIAASSTRALSALVLDPALIGRHGQRLAREEAAAAHLDFCYYFWRSTRCASGTSSFQAVVRHAE